jgi:hypothetical protein
MTPVAGRHAVSNLVVGTLPGVVEDAGRAAAAVANRGALAARRAALVAVASPVAERLVTRQLAGAAKRAAAQRCRQGGVAAVPAVRAPLRVTERAQRPAATGAVPCAAPEWT